MEWLRDPVWAFLGVVIGALISVVLFRLQQSRKALSYEIVSSTSLLSINDEVKSDVAILYKGKPVRNVHLIIVKIVNSGKLPILDADFVNPLEFDFGKKTELLSAEIMDTVPSNLQVSISLVSEVIKISPLLLNPGDSIKLKVLMSGYDDTLNVSTRVVGVKEITGLDQTDKEKRVRRSYKIAIVVVIYGLMVALVLPILGAPQFVTVASVSGIVVQALWEIIVTKYAIIRASRYRSFIETLIGLLIGMSLAFLLLGIYYLIYGHIGAAR
jgi:hypothetical protein